MQLFADFKKIKFHKGLLELYTGKLLIEFGSDILGVFFSIFLYQQYKSLNLVILFFFVSHLAYAVTVPWGAKLMNKLGMKQSLLWSVFARLFILLAFYFFPQNIFFYTVIALVSLTMMRNLFWVPFHTESARLSDKDQRGKQFSILFAVTAILGVLAPLVAGFVLDKWNFQIIVLIAVFFCLLSLWPLLKVEESQEKFSWTIKETWHNFFHPFNRRLVLACMSDGFVNLVQNVFWPLFIFSILQEQYRAMGLLTALILLVSVILHLFIGSLLDNWKKAKVLHIGVTVNASAWFFKALVSSGLQIFLVSTYHALAIIILHNSFNTMIYERTADQGHYIDEYTVLREMADGFGRIVGLVLIFLLLLLFPLQAVFVLAGLVALFINLLKE